MVLGQKYLVNTVPGLPPDVDGCGRTPQGVGTPIGHANQLEAVLGQLREFADPGAAAQERPAARPTPDLHAQRGSAASLLALRLQQVEVWPRPDDYMVGTFGRALWSLWSPITGKRAPRRCQWRAGCTRLLPDGAHGNRRYCGEHRREVNRERAARNCSRLSTARSTQETGRGGRPIAQ